MDHSDRAWHIAIEDKNRDRAWDILIEYMAHSDRTRTHRSRTQKIEVENTVNRDRTQRIEIENTVIEREHGK